MNYQYCGKCRKYTSMALDDYDLSSRDEMPQFLMALICAAMSMTNVQMHS